MGLAWPVPAGDGMPLAASPTRSRDPGDCALYHWRFPAVADLSRFHNFIIKEHP